MFFFTETPLSRRYPPGKLPEQRPGPAGGARARNRQQRTAALCDAALPLFLSRGLETTTVDAITQGAGVAKGSFYRYFEDKEQLVATLFAPFAEALDAALDGCAEAIEAAEGPAALFGAYEALAGDLAAAFTLNPEVVRLYLQEHRGPDEGARRPIRTLASRMREGAISLTEAAHARALLRPLPPAVTALAVVGAVEAILAAALEGELAFDPPSVIQSLVDMMLKGVAAD